MHQEATMDGETVIARSSHLTSVDVQDETVILDLGSGQYYGLEGVGARIWQMLQQPTKLEELCKLIVTEYEVEDAVAEHDIAQLIEDLSEKGLVEIRS
jgi:GH35 family endo-1,4-beta-xylanase